MTDADPGPHDRHRWGATGRERWAWGGPPGPGQPWGRRRGPGRMGAGFFGCLFLALVVFVGVLTALATWVAAFLLGIIAPGASPPTATVVAVVVVLVVAIVVGGRAFFLTVRPLADLAAASERLADGEPGVRVAPRGPGPVRRLGASFNAMAERLDRSRDDRRALLADVTHELRTPLTVISGGLEAMLDGVHPMDEDHVSPILAEAVVMDRLLDDLRTISLAEAGALPLHREPVDIGRDRRRRAGRAARRSRRRGGWSCGWTAIRRSTPTSTRSGCARSSSTSSRTPCGTPRRAAGSRSASEPTAPTRC